MNSIGSARADDSALCNLSHTSTPDRMLFIIVRTTGGPKSVMLTHRNLRAKAISSMLVSQLANNNVEIGNLGFPGDNSVIRIGSDYSSDYAYQVAFFAAGIPRRSRSGHGRRPSRLKIAHEPAPQ